MPTDRSGLRVSSNISCERDVSLKFDSELPPLPALKLAGS